MKFTQKSHVQEKLILANDHYVAMAVRFDLFSSAAENGVIKAGTILPANDATAQGVALYDVDLNRNPNGAIVVHGFIEASKLPVAPSEEAMAALTQIKFIGAN